MANFINSNTSVTVSSKKKILKRLLLCICGLAILSCALVTVLIFKAPKEDPDFSLELITSKLDYNPNWEITDTSKIDMSIVNQIVDQTFIFLGRGRQSVAFSSEDNAYVLKFLKCKRFEVSPLLKSFSCLPIVSYYYRKESLRKNIRKENLFESWKIAFQDLKEETGLLYVHLNKTQSLNKKIKIVDHEGVSHILNLDDYHFCIQKRADPSFVTIKEAMEKDNVTVAKKLIDEMVTMVTTTHDKGILDLDPFLECNSGYLNNHAVHIDIGRFERNEQVKIPAFSSHIMYHTFKHLRKWLQKDYPELHQYLDEQLAACSGNN